MMPCRQGGGPGRRDKLPAASVQTGSAAALKSKSWISKSKLWTKKSTDWIWNICFVDFQIYFVDKKVQPLDLQIENFDKKADWFLSVFKRMNPLPSLGRSGSHASVMQDRTCR